VPRCEIIQRSICHEVTRLSRESANMTGPSVILDDNGIYIRDLDCSPRSRYPQRVVTYTILVPASIEALWFQTSTGVKVQMPWRVIPICLIFSNIPSNIGPEVT
jgi:hypothetical protein